MDVTRDSSQRPDAWPPALPEPHLAEFPLPDRPRPERRVRERQLSGSTQLSRAIADVVAKPLIKGAPPKAEDEVDGPPTQPLTAQPPARHVTLRASSAGETHSARRPPRIDPALREQRARDFPGWIALLTLIAAATGAVLLLAWAGVVPPLDALPEIRSATAQRTGAADINAGVIAGLCAAGLLAVVTLAGLLVNAGGDTRVLTRWGHYRGTVRRTGLVWVNPLLRRRRVDVRLRHWRSEPVDVTDRDGTPLVVRLLIVWRVKDTARAVFGLAAHEDYLREQVHAVLTRTASALPCDSNSAPGPVLRDGEWFADELTRALAAEVAPAGMEVYSVQPLALDYAPEVADSMRRRRLADLDAGLRTVLVDDAVEAAALAVRRLERATAQELDQAARSALMEQLLVAFVAPAGVPARVPAPAARAGRKEPRPT